MIPASWRKLFAAWWPMATLFALILAYFTPALLEGRLLAPGDGFAENFPLRVLAARAYWGGELPFWNPYQFGGLPLLAGINVGVFFPGSVAFLLLPAVAAHNLTVLIAFAVAASGGYQLARALELGRLAALYAAVTFAFGGFMIAHIDHLNIQQAAGLLPWLLFAAERFRRTLDTRYALLGAGLLALQVLAGHPQMTAYSLLLTGAYGLFRGVSLERKLRPAYAGQLLAIVMVALGLAAFQLLPTLDFIPETQRKAISFAQLTSHSVPLRHLVTFLFPYLYGGQPWGLFTMPYWGAGPYYQELTGYVGLPTLALALVALFGWRRGAYQGQTRFWLGYGVVALLLTLGGHTPLYGLVAKLPVLQSMPHPGRHFLEVDLALALLGAFGLERLARTAHAAEARLLALKATALLALPLVGTLLAVGILGAEVAGRLQPYMPSSVDMQRAMALTEPAYWVPVLLFLAWLALALTARPARAWRAAVLGLLVLDLALFGQHFEWRVLSPIPGDRLVVADEPFDGTGRTLGLSHQMFPYYDLAHLNALRIAPLSALRGTRSIGGYGPFIPARLAWHMGQSDSFGHFSDPKPYQRHNHAFEILGLKRLRLDPVLLAKPAWQARLTPDRWQPFKPAQADVAIYRFRPACRHAVRVTRAQVLSQALVDQRVAGDPAFDPCDEALLEAGAIAGPLTPGIVSAKNMSFNTIRVTTSGAGPGLVIVNEGYDPGWRAFIGSQELPVQRANALVLGVSVPAGDHVVTLRYQPRLWPLGVYVSLASLVLWALWAWWGYRRRFDAVHIRGS